MDCSWQKAEREGRRIWVGNIREHVTKNELRQFFLEASIEVEEVFFPQQRRMKGTDATFAFVSLTRKEDVPGALSLDRVGMICGWHVNVGRAHPKLHLHRALDSTGKVCAPKKSDNAPMKSGKSSIENESEQCSAGVKQMDEASDASSEVALEERGREKLPMTSHRSLEVVNQLQRWTRAQDVIRQRDDALTGKGNALAERDNALQLLNQALKEQDVLRGELVATKSERDALKKQLAEEGKAAQWLLTRLLDGID